MKLPAWFVGEFFGTFLLVFFGCGSVAAAVLTGAQVGVFQVAIVWGWGIATAIYLTGALSGAHLNPAVTCALATCGSFPARRVPGYVAAQFTGAFVAAAVLHGMFAGVLQAYETAHGIVRGAAGSEATAMIFGEFFPNPGGKPLTQAMRAMVSPGAAFAIEAIGAAVLALVILCVTDERNAGRPRELAPATIGLDGDVAHFAVRTADDGGLQPGAGSRAENLERAGRRVGRGVVHGQRLGVVDGLRACAARRRAGGRNFLSGIFPCELRCGSDMRVRIEGMTAVDWPEVVLLLERHSEVAGI